VSSGRSRDFRGGGFPPIFLSVAPSKRTDELRRLLQTARSYFLTAAMFSLAINLLYLAGPLYMLQVYDRVISSASEVTLVMLTIALLLAFMALAGLDAVRARVLTRASIRLDQNIAARVMTAIIDRSATSGGARSQLLRDFDTFRQFITGMGIHAIFDLPWAPIYIGVIFVLHPALGAFALGCSVLLVLMARLNEWIVKPPLTESGEAASRNYSFTEMSLRNTEVVRAMGMTDGLLKRWARDRNRMLERQVTASDRAATMQSLIKFLRLSMQSLILGLGAYLVIERLATVGAMFAASILLGRALQPVEQLLVLLEPQLLARSIYHEHGADVQNRRALDEAVVAQCAAGVDQIHDPVRQPEQRRHFDAATHADHLHAETCLREEATRQPRVLGRDPRGHAAAERGVEDLRRARDDHAAAAKPERQWLEHVGLRLAQDVGAGYAHIRGARLDVHRNVCGLHEQQRERAVRRRDEQLAGAGWFRPCGADFPEQRQRRLEQAPLGERQRERDARRHGAATASASRSIASPTAGRARPKRPIRSS